MGQHLDPIYSIFTCCQLKGICTSSRCKTTQVNMLTYMSQGSVLLPTELFMPKIMHQLNIAEVDEETGRMTGQYKTYALCGEIRRMGESDDCLSRLAKKDGILPKSF